MLAGVRQGYLRTGVALLVKRWTWLFISGLLLYLYLLYSSRGADCMGAAEKFIDYKPDLKRAVSVGANVWQLAFARCDIACADSGLNFPLVFYFLHSWGVPVRAFTL